MVRDTIIEAFKNSWPMFAIVLVIIIALRLTDIYINKKPFIIYHELMMLGFISYILCLFYVVTFDDVEWSSSNFTPFREIMRYDLGSRLFFKNVIDNILMFAPYGFFASYYLSAKNIKPIIFLTLLTSFTIETTQLIIGRVFDVDDIMLNLLGGILGYFIYRLIIIIKNILPPFLRSDWFFNILTLILIVLLSFYLLNFFNLGRFIW